MGEESNSRTLKAAEQSCSNRVVRIKIRAEKPERSSYHFAESSEFASEAIHGLECRPVC
jgi:hypothetical protein